VARPNAHAGPAALDAVSLGSASIEPFRDLLARSEWESFTRTMHEVAQGLGDRSIWNINSTAHGGGVAEMLAWQIPYERSTGMQVDWLVIEGDTTFFTFTKRLHALLHGVPADGSSISEGERTVYEQTLARNAAAIDPRIESGDVVILHDPQTAGLVPHFVERGCLVVWRCHIGVDQPNEVARGAWRFLLPSVMAAHACVFSRAAYVWEGIDQRKVEIIAPAIDAFAPKNEDLSASSVAAILHATGIVETGESAAGEPVFRAGDGASRRVERPTDLFPPGAIAAGVPLTVQVSRWDRLKDPVGVLNGFAEFVVPRSESHLVLAGPGTSAVADDPEEAGILRDVQDRWRELPPATRHRIHLARLPMADGDENAAIVNALQRRAAVVVQKSLREGFGLTVAEAMWKARPVVASRVGGIQDQIEDAKSGLLIDDPRDLRAFGGAVAQLLGDPARADRLGEAARVRVRTQFLAPRLLMQQAQLVSRLIRSAS
jgi:trehalose synthase